MTKETEITKIFNEMKTAQNKMIDRKKLTEKETTLLSFVFSYGFYNGAKEYYKKMKNK